MISSLFILLVTTILPVLADFGPYYRSDAYGNGDFGPWPHETYRSSPELGPSLNYIEHNPQCNDGQYTFIAPHGRSVRTPGPMVIDQNGHLVWTRHYYGQTYNFNVQQYKGQDHLTFWLGHDGITDRGGKYYMLDSSYEEVYTISGANGLVADFHEFHITRDGTAVFTVLEPTPAGERPGNAPGGGSLKDSLFQEIYIETGELLFQWRASEHIDLAGIYDVNKRRQDSTNNPGDLFLISSVDKDEKGNFLVSVRQAHSLIYIDGRTGEIIWKLGGRDNMFKDLSEGAATDFTSPSYARFEEDGKAIILYDNEPSTESGSPSRGLYLSVDPERMTAQLLHAYSNPHGTRSRSQGCIQLLSSGNILVGHGTEPSWTEYTIYGDILSHVTFGPESTFNTDNITTYHAFKHPWTGLPKTRPSIALSAYEAAASWKGATEVVTWVLQGTNTSYANENENEFKFLSAVPKTGFETIISIPVDTASQFLRLLALNSAGQALGSTKLLHWDPKIQDIVTSPVELPPPPPPDNRPIIYFTIGFGTAGLLAILIWAARYYVTAYAKRGRVWDEDRGTWRRVDTADEDDEDLSDDDLVGVELSLMGKSSNEYQARRQDIPEIVIEEYDDF